MKEEIRLLKEQVQDLTMRLTAIKVIVGNVSPLCSDKMKQLLQECEGCRNGNTESD